MMKQVKIIHNNIERKLQYEVMSDCGEGTASFYWTEFYEGTEVKTYKKFLLFGETITIEKPKLIFKLYFNVENIRLTKGEISTALHKQLELLDREKEIANGELI